MLHEYCNIAIKKLKLSPQYIRAQLNVYQQFEVVQVTPTIIRVGIDLHQTRSVAFYDALVLASVKIASCRLLLSEDMNTGEHMDAVQIINPFID